MLRKWLLLLLVVGLAACSTSSPPGKPGGGPRDTATPSALPSWSQQELGDTLAALKQSCKAIARKPGWAEVCRQADGISNDNTVAVRQFFENRFAAWKVNDGARDSGLITGYYEPLLNGSRVRSARTPWPVYGIPADFYSVDVPQAMRGKSSLMARRSGPNRLALSSTGDIEIRPADFPADNRATRLKGRLDGKRLLPYYTRAEINQGKGVSNAPILAWAEDPVELFFLQVQGSGRIQLDDGSFIHIGYAEQNGYGYQSIGKWLVDKGELTMGDASMQGIKDWLARNPQRQQELFAVNPSYVFFKTLPGDNGGPVGALGVPLTGGYSIAVDPRYIPLGAPVYLVTTWPHSTQALARLVHAQDTGSAIKGAVRADFFWGFGTEAGMYAGRMKQQGNLWMLLPKGMSPSQAL